MFEWKITLYLYNFILTNLMKEIYGMKQGNSHDPKSETFGLGKAKHKDYNILLIYLYYPYDHRIDWCGNDFK